MTEDELAPDELRGLGEPWCLTDATARLTTARALETTPATIQQAFDVLERCRRRAAAHPRPVSTHEQVQQSPSLAWMGDAWADWRRPLEAAMPTLDDVRVSNVVALLQRDEVDVPDDSERRKVPVPRQRPPLDVVVELTRVWANGLWPTLTDQVSDWLYERLRRDGSKEDRRRYFALLAAVVPDLGDYGGSLVTHLELAGGLEAAPYLLCIERHPRTGEGARRNAGECLRRLERIAHPHGDGLPSEIWNLRGRRLAGVRRGFVRQYEGPPEDQMLELSFEDGAAIQIRAGYDGQVRFEEGPYDLWASESRVEAEGFEEAVLLADDVVWYLHDDGDAPLVADAIGRTLTDFRSFRGGDDDHDGLVLQFEATMVRLEWVADLHCEIAWGSAASGWMED